MATPHLYEKAPLPSASPIRLSQNAILQPPLSRRGHGPGLIILSAFESDSFKNETLDPLPLQKWAEEGYTVVEAKLKDVESVSGKRMDVDGLWSVEEAVGKSMAALKAFEACDDKEKFGVIVYKIRKHGSSRLIQFLEGSLDSLPSITAIISYDGIITTSIPQLLHISGPLSATDSKSPTQKVYNYPDARSSNFILPSSKDFRDGDASLAHTRSLTFLKKLMGGPEFDLEAIWEEHTYFEFGTRDVEATMGTMVQEPYVNHIPTMTGGIGRKALTAFYTNHFIFANPDDTHMELVSRTVGIDRVIDEFLMCFTHDKEIDWLAPGIPPTGKPCRVPFTSIVNIRGDRLYHEHISWDQASLLVQLGLLPAYLKFPYQLPGGVNPAPGKRFEYQVPAAGLETAEKLVNESSVTSNEMFAFKVREVDDI